MSMKNDDANKGTTMLDRNEAIERIKTGLGQRSGKPWSVTGGRGTSWGWITIMAPPRRRNEYGSMADADRADLARLLGLESVHQQGVSIPAGGDYRQEYVDRAEGLTPSVIGQQYWD